jgi:aspartyl/asparaginyl beta-hydroxylase (cupin superfamily)
VGAYAITRRWGQPAWLQHAALIHSVYGTDAYRQSLLPLSRRDEVAAVAGNEAERLAYLFCVTPREPLLAGTYRWARNMPWRMGAGGSDEGDQTPPSRPELDALILLHMVNLAEQARARDGSPGRWLVRLRELAELVLDSHELELPPFIAQLATLSEDDESLTRRAYQAGASLAGDPEARASALALAAAVCPVVPEPCVWQAHLAWARDDVESARRWGACARTRLFELGTAWDKRLTFEEWLEVTEALARVTSDDQAARTRAIDHPRALFEATALASSRSPGQASAPARSAIAEPSSEAGRHRFLRYLESFDWSGDSAPGALYPDLASQPWYDPHDFPLVRYLESHYPAIREEILTLAPSRFHRESERIKRSGDWDVAFLYERGRRHDEVCDACPVTTHGIDGYPAIRTSVGLIYVSRMRAGTHIRPHRGPTNLRVRCHLPLEVPDGDCALRVGEQVRQWEEGSCLVFDDFFEHEAWNATDRDRIVLIVDMWHPGLSSTEVGMLESLHRYTFWHARKLSRYWSVNARSKMARTVPDSK